MTQFIAFEQPLHERIRTFLRFEQLMQRFEHSASRGTRWDTHCALAALLEVADLVARVDVKSELMKELKRQTANLEVLNETPGVDQSHLRAIIDNHRQLISMLHGLSGHPVGPLKRNEFLNSIKQRTAIPGGTCDFDLPAYHYWLAKQQSERMADIEGWMQPFRQINEAVVVTLNLIRESAHPRQMQAPKGFYQQNLDASQPNQMIRISMPADAPYFPEISAGKHRFSVRFLELRDLEARSTQTQEDVEFQLACCAL